MYIYSSNKGPDPSFWTSEEYENAHRRMMSKVHKVTAQKSLLHVHQK